MGFVAKYCLALAPGFQLKHGIRWIGKRMITGDAGSGNSCLSASKQNGWQGDPFPMNVSVEYLVNDHITSHNMGRIRFRVPTTGWLKLEG